VHYSIPISFVNNKLVCSSTFRIPALISITGDIMGKAKDKQFSYQLCLNSTPSPPDRLRKRSITDAYRKHTLKYLSIIWV